MFAHGGVVQHVSGWLLRIYLLSENQCNTLLKIGIEHCKQEIFSSLVLFCFRCS